MVSNASDVIIKQPYQKLLNGNAKYWVIFALLHIAIFIILILFISASVYKRKITKNKIRTGQEAEEKAKKLLMKFANENNFTLLNGIFSVINDKNHDIQFEVDGILVTNSSIIVIEVKSKPLVIKSSHSKDYLYVYDKNSRNKEKNKFINPTIQNDKHISHLRNIISKDIPIYSVIFFPNASDVQVDSPNLETIFLSSVNPMKELANFLNSKTSDKAFSNQEKQSIISIIKNAQANDEAKYKFYNIIGKYDRI
ncbi:nuclease-related domain-containing protein [Mycoplasma phocimorsus]|uniref:nuclease-related domain-containing protein n=1 Tax=Mycoplasma phocimorsus TaxID=3045839 RepID=UPI0024C00476|nr:nuclease-related domain-containing protein [Mycoplasma phocimorsus]MDJ1646829.1 nuclease-related domain-containing protein [Mycoplasma phocimorsus]MDJ1648641.1 nuclease-related domain-containing protein [Mycoplasma phocimorsus]